MRKPDPKDPWRLGNVLAWIAFFVGGGLAAVSFWSFRKNIRWVDLYELSPCVVGVFIAYAAIRLSIHALSTRRLPYPPGHCQTCGYNLTGNVSGVCPECGTPVSA